MLLTSVRVLISKRDPRTLVNFLCSSMKVCSVPKTNLYYTKPKRQRDSGIFWKFCTSLSCIHQKRLKHNNEFLSIDWNISDNH